MKKTLLFALLALLPLMANAYDAQIDGIYYNFNISTMEAEVTSGDTKYKGSVEIPETVKYNDGTYSVTSIGEMAFDYCSDLTSVTIPNSVTSIGDCAFYASDGLTSLTLPQSVTSIGEQAFLGCSGLTSIIVDKGNVIYDSRGNSNAIIETSTNLLILGCQSTVIPNSVTSIGDFAFYGCSGLTSITIPNNMTRIGDGAFLYCSGLTSVTIPESVTSIGIYAFHNTEWYDYQTEGLVYAGKVAYKYKGTMPEGTHIDLKEGTLGIARSAFDNCSGLTSITIPNSVTSIGYSAFSGTAWYNNQPDGLVYAGKVAYKYKGTMPEGTEIVIKDGTLGITASAFSGCTSLTSVTIPNSVTTIGNGAFSNCSGLTSISIPNSVSRIGEWSFEYCTGLESVTMSENVTTISNSIFSYCSALKAITIPNSVTSIGQNAFYNCSGLTSVTIGNSVTSIGGSAFVGCIRLTSITIPNSVASIGSNAFPSATKIYVDKGASALIAVWNYCRSPYDLSTNTLLQIPTISKTNNCASSLQLLGSSSSNGVQFTNESFTVDGVTKAGHSVTCTGLRPNTSYPVQYSTTVTYGGSSSVYTRYDYFKTSSLLLTLSTPKVISLGNVIVAATSNLDDEEENVGFEWRRMDWSDDMLSNTGAAYMYEGTMEGYIRSLNTNYYWKVRPYYKSNDGTYYYGEWGGFDPTNTSYFEPTVHTYAKINVTGNKAHVSGYVQRASDAVIRQGFKYWIQEDNAREAEDNARGAGVIIPSSAKTVEAEGRIMEAVFTNLQYNTTYTYVAFVTTTEGETFYGKQQAFTTGEDPDATILGDANDSGEVEIGDITSVLTLMANPDAPGYNNNAADANQSGEIEIGDITTILTIMAGGE